MALTKKPYRGTRDFFPLEKRIQDYIFSVMHKTARSFAYEHYDGPLLEEVELYKAKSGEELINEQIYSFTDRGDRFVAIRPEMTPTLARMVASVHREEPKPIRWYSIPNLMRYEKPQKGRLREHWQFNCDIFGAPERIGEIEVLQMVIELLENFGANEKHFEVLVNDRLIVDTVFKKIINASDEDTYKLYKIVDKAKKVKTDAIEKMLSETSLDDKQKAHFHTYLSCQSFDDALNFLNEHKHSKESESLKSLMDKLKTIGLGNYLTFDPTIVRGLDYYTGIVFEVFDKNPDNRRAICGGGAYANLLTIFNEEALPGVGFGLGDVTLKDFLITHNLLPDLSKPNFDLLLTCQFEEGLFDMMSLGKSLRACDHRVFLQPAPLKFKKVFSLAEKKGINCALFYGENEKDQGIVQLKNLSTKEQVDIPITNISEMSNFIKKMRAKLMSDLSTTYSPKDVEKKWYKTWEEGGYFKPKKGKADEGFCIIMPPPNVTGKLHAGHALDVLTQDALIRFKRMKGFEALWLPGMDHAGIATQNVVEKMVYAKEKKTRRDFTREEFVEKIWQWKEESGGVIAEQMRSLGASPDWDYFMFTMDKEANEAVRKVFVKLFNEGLIYQSDYIINWDPVLQSAISDAEVEHSEVKGAFYHLLYNIKDSDEQIEIATTRPETLLGDTAICVHPEDDRFSHLIGKMAIVPLCNREVPIIADDYVDREKGTGCLKVTPGHDFNDFEIGRRHNLPIINIINKDGTLNDYGLEWEGQSCSKARKKIADKLEELGHLKEIKKHVHQVGHGDRSKAIIEPMVSKQWFLNVQDMAKESVDAVENDDTVFYPKSWENTYFAWMREPKNWCISRQLWWGHQIPVFYCSDCNHQWASEKDETSCAKCQSSKIKQDPDVLDTWFSSALWPMSTLGWPNEKRMVEKKFDTFFPTSVLVTGFDIIFFWVARMMMMSLKFTEKVPFKKVYIHAIVRDKQGRKMSKSLGNGIDPLEMIDLYGADAFRFTLAAGSGYNRNINLDPDRIGGYRNFINKIWNAFRFISPYLEKAKEELPAVAGLDNQERWILSQLNTVTKSMNESLEEFRYDDSCSALYSFIYDDFCSWFIELSKPVFTGGDTQLIERRATVLKFAFRKVVALLHPISPYITEELWSHLKNDGEDLLIAQEYPEFTTDLVFDKEQGEMNKFIEVVSTIRNLRASVGLSPKEEITAILKTDEPNMAAYYMNNKEGFAKLANIVGLDILSKSESSPSKSLMGATTHTEVYLPMEGVIDLKDQVSRLEKELSKAEKEFLKYDKKMTNEKFMANAKEEVIIDVKKNHSDLLEKVNSLKKSIEDFS